MLTLLTWIVIAFIVCIIFGIIKVEDVRAFAAKWTPKAKKALSQAKTLAEKKAAELKAAAENNKKEDNQDDRNSDDNTSK